MSILIKGMEMPKEYGPHEITITLFVRDDGTASLWGKEVFIPHEPLEVVPVQDHGRLIDADRLPISVAAPLNGDSYLYVHKDNIDRAPTINPVPDHVDAIFSTNYTETITTGENREKTEKNCGY